MSTYPEPLPLWATWGSMTICLLSGFICQVKHVTRYYCVLNRTSLSRHTMFCDFWLSAATVFAREGTKEASESTYSTYRRDTWSHVGNHTAERKNSSGLDVSSECDWMTICAHNVCACVRCVHAKRVLVTACEAAFQKEERYLIIPCAPTQVIQMIWTLSIGADGHYRAYICNLLPFKCILEKRGKKRDNLAYWTFTPEGKLPR